MGKVKITKKMAEVIEVLRKRNWSNSEIIGAWSYAQTSDNGIKELKDFVYETLVSALEEGYEILYRRQDVEGYTDLRTILANPYDFIARYAVIHVNGTYRVGKILSILKHGGTISIDGVMLSLTDFGKTWDLLSNLTETELKEVDEYISQSSEEEIAIFNNHAGEAKEWFHKFIERAKELYEQEKPSPQNQTYTDCGECDGFGYDDVTGFSCKACDGIGIAKPGENGNCEPCNGTGVAYGFVCSACNGLGDVEKESEPTIHKTKEEVLQDLHALAHAAVDAGDRKWFDEIHEQIKEIKGGKK